VGMGVYWINLCSVDREYPCAGGNDNRSMKKAKTLEVKLRSAIRLIWSRSTEHRSVIKGSSYKGTQSTTIPQDEKGLYFQCPICRREWPIQMADVDHEPPVGELASWEDTTEFIRRMFFGPQRAICKLCHKTKTAMQRRKGNK
jgi:hypothetical protein